MNLPNEKNNGMSVLKLISDKMIASAHDISAGGLILALAEMSMSSEYGLKIEKPQKLSNIMEFYFGEDQGRYLVEIEPKNLQNVIKILNKNNIFSESIAVVQKNYFEVLDEFKINTKDLYKTNNKWYNNY